MHSVREFCRRIKEPAEESPWRSRLLRSEDSVGNMPGVGRDLLGPPPSASCVHCHCIRWTFPVNYMARDGFDEFGFRETRGNNEQAQMGRTQCDTKFGDLVHEGRGLETQWKKLEVFRMVTLAAGKSFRTYWSGSLEGGFFGLLFFELVKIECKENYSL